jgi:hypothetical protein
MEPNAPGPAQATPMRDVIDYAGLFPPAALPMGAALDEYAAASTGPDAHMLGRFVITAAHLPAFAETVVTRPDLPARLPLSVIVRPGSDDDHRAVVAFDASALASRAPITSLECRPQAPSGIAWLVQAYGTSRAIYVEVDVTADLGPWLDAIARHHLRAKVRTGGLTPDAFPAPDALLRTLDAFVTRRIPFKATAGLHHAVRGTYPLTYAPDSARATMYGYLNVLLATAALRAGRPRAEALALLLQPDGLVVGDEGATWGAMHLSPDVIAATRRDHFTSFGSCSFREPAGEFHAHAAH